METNAANATEEETIENNTLDQISVSISAFTYLQNPSIKP